MITKPMMPKIIKVILHSDEDESHKNESLGKSKFHEKNK